MHSIQNRKLNQKALPADDGASSPDERNQPSTSQEPGNKNDRSHPFELNFNFARVFLLNNANPEKFKIDFNPVSIANEAVNYKKKKMSLENSDAQPRQQTIAIDNEVNILVRSSESEGDVTEYEARKALKMNALEEVFDLYATAEICEEDLNATNYVQLCDNFVASQLFDNTEDCIVIEDHKVTPSKTASKARSVQEIDALLKFVFEDSEDDEEIVQLNQGTSMQMKTSSLAECARKFQQERSFNSNVQAISMAGSKENSIPDETRQDVNQNPSHQQQFQVQGHNVQSARNSLDKLNDRFKVKFPTNAEAPLRSLNYNQNLNQIFATSLTATEKLLLDVKKTSMARQSCSENLKENTMRNLRKVFEGSNQADAFLKEFNHKFSR